MKNQSNIPVRKVNRLAIVGLVAGFLSILPYLPLLAHFLLLALNALVLEKNTIYEKIPMIVYNLVGILFGSFGLVTSNMALKQIKIGGDVEKGYRMVVTGKALSIFGIIANIGVFLIIGISALFLRG